MNYRQYKKLAREMVSLGIIMQFGHIAIREYYKYQRRRRRCYKILERNRGKCKRYIVRLEKELSARKTRAKGGDPGK